MTPIPKKLRDFALRHRINFGKGETARGFIYFVRPPGEQLKTRYMTASESPTVGQGLAVMRRWIKDHPRKNPSGYKRATESYVREIDRAADAYEAFTGARATHQTRYKKPAVRAGFALGKLVAVEYRATRDGETNVFRHDFKKSCQPLLIGSDDGSQLDVVGGQIRVTERGIEDC